MLKTIGIIVAVLLVAIAGLVTYASMKPDSFHVARSTTINAPPEKLFALINDFHEWGKWSPYENLDPALKRTYSGAASGVGTVYAWEGDKAGQGRMEITEASAPSKIVIRLDFLKPFEAHNTAEFTIAPVDGGMEVTWAMDGPSPLIAKVMGVFYSMDSMVGGQFAEGLARLKAVAEAP